MVRGKSSLLWITQEIKRLIRKRDRLYRNFKTTGDQTKRSQFLCLRKLIKCKTKLAYITYLEGLLGLDSETSTACDSKKLFSFLKNSRQDQVGSPPLKQGSKLITEPVQKGNVQNNQFQSVFTPKEPLTLSRLCTMKVQDMVDKGLLDPESVPAGSFNHTTAMNEFNISVGGILKLLKKLTPGKVACPDKLKPLLLRELAIVILNFVRRF